MNTFIRWSLVTIILYVLQSSILARLSIHGVAPDFLLLMTLSFGFLRGAHQGVLMGFCAGLLMDVASGTFFGVNTFIKMLVGFICGKLSDHVFKEQFVLPVLTSPIAVVANYFILAMFMLLLGYRFNLMAHMQYTLVPMVIYNLIFAYPVYKLVYSQTSREQRGER